MGKQHKTTPNEPQEAPVQQPKPEVQQPKDPHDPFVPQEGPNNEPVEVPQPPDQSSSEWNQTEV